MPDNSTDILSLAFPFYSIVVGREYGLVLLFLNNGSIIGCLDVEGLMELL
jgi:hypothetical protein